MKLLRSLFLVVLISSCSAQYHFDQACKKEPMFCQDEVQVLYDTTIIKDSLYFYKEYYTKSIDTILIDTGGMVVKIIRENNIIRTEIKQPADTIRIQTTKTIKAPTKWRVVDLNKWLLLLLVIGGIVGWVFKTRRV